MIFMNFLDNIIIKVLKDLDKQIFDIMVELGEKLDLGTLDNDEILGSDVQKIREEILRVLDEINERNVSDE